MIKVRFKLLFFVAISFLIILLFTCVFNITDYRVLKISGITGCFNFSRNGIYFGSLSKKDGTTSVIARDGDLLYLTFDNNNIYYLYNNSDGNILNFRLDDFKIMLNDKLIGMFFLNDKKVNNYILNLKKNELKNIQFIIITEELNEENIKVLNEIVKKNSIPGLVINENSKMDLSFFDPQWYVGNDNEQLNSFKKIKFLCINNNDLKNFNNLKNLKKLTTLLLFNWDPEKTGPIPIELKNIKHLSIFGSVSYKINDFSNCAQLSELVVTNNKVDIGLNESFKNLETFIPVNFSMKNDLNTLKQFHNLKYFRIPSNISQEDFDIILKKNKGLQVLEIFSQKQIKNFDSLKKLTSLKGVIINESDIDLNILSTLKHLKIIIIPNDTYKNNPELILRLEKSLPDCEIIPGEGLCLGSAWILILPAIFVMFSFYLIIRRKIKKNEE